MYTIRVLLVAALAAVTCGALDTAPVEVRTLSLSLVARHWRTVERSPVIPPVGIKTVMVVLTLLSFIVHFRMLQSKLPKSSRTKPTFPTSMRGRLKNSSVSLGSFQTRRKGRRRRKRKKKARVGRVERVVVKE
jgi:hypothetical protein